MKLSVIAAAALIGVLASNLTSAATITNPSFEANGDVSGNGYTTSITGWTSGGDLYAGFGGVPLTAVSTVNQAFGVDSVIPNGTHVAAMQVFDTSIFNTTLTTTITDLAPGSQYIITFRENARGDTADVVNASVTLNGATIVPSHGVTHISTPLPYALVTSLPFTAAADTATLTFANQKPEDDRRDASWVIDNVQVTAVPEPATLGLMSIAGFGLLRRRAR